jgi:uncharacterized membrane protein (DUF4010 family)
VTGTLPPLLIAFALTLALSFLSGLALREYYIAQEHLDYFGSVRTYTFVGMLGFGLYQLPQAGIAYPAGLVSLAAFLAIYYWRKSGAGKPGMIGVLTALLTYLIGPLSLIAPPWFVILFAVSLLFALSAKERIRTLSERITQREVVTLATFLTLAGVILPLLPQDVIAPFLPLTPHQIWLAVVASTGVSYASYLLQSFAFPRKGLLLSGFLGGLYSSTVTTYVIARRSRHLASSSPEIAAGLIAATAMMYFRLTVLVAIFDINVALNIAPLFLVLALATAVLAYIMAQDSPGATPATPLEASLQRNPLELTAAALFAALLIVMAIATHFALEIAPGIGLNTLATAAGLYDIDPFVISLLQTHTPIARAHIVDAIVLATAANNVLKAACTGFLAPRAAAVRAVTVLLILAAVSYAYVQFSG